MSDATEQLEAPQPQVRDVMLTMGGEALVPPRGALTLLVQLPYVFRLEAVRLVQRGTEALTLLLRLEGGPDHGWACPLTAQLVQPCRAPTAQTGCIFYLNVLNHTDAPQSLVAQLAGVAAE